MSRDVTRLNTTPLESEKDLLIGLTALRLEVPSRVWDDIYERATAYVKEANGLLEQLEAAGRWHDSVCDCGAFHEHVAEHSNPATSPPADPRNNRQFPTATGSYDQPRESPDPASSLKRYEDELAVPCQEPERSSLVDGEGLDPASEPKASQ